MSAPEVQLRPLGDAAKIAALWRELETRSDCSFFQTWDWLGLVWEQARPEPIVAIVRAGDKVVGLATFGCRGMDRWLNETGDPAVDHVYSEQHGVLAERGSEAVVRAAVVSALLQSTAGSWRRVHASRVAPEELECVRLQCPTVRLTATVPSPFVDLDRLRDAGADYLSSLGANARAQIRRSMRLYEKLGTLDYRRARTVTEAHDYLGLLETLHGQSWERRGRPGAFANPRFRDFHRTLIDRSFRSGSIELAKVAAGSTAVGVLYNFVWQNKVYAYQSGLAYGPTPRHKPGLVCHCLAIETHFAEGRRVYDFLAGGQRYKRDLANAAHELVSFTLHAGVGDYRKARLLDQVRRARDFAAGLVRS